MLNCDSARIEALEIAPQFFKPMRFVIRIAANDGQNSFSLPRSPARAILCASFWACLLKTTFHNFTSPVLPSFRKRLFSRA
jgi:hypothetical protein